MLVLMDTLDDIMASPQPKPAPNFLPFAQCISWPSNALDFEFDTRIINIYERSFNLSEIFICLSHLPSHRTDFYLFCRSEWMPAVPAGHVATVAASVLSAIRNGTSEKKINFLFLIYEFRIFFVPFFSIHFDTNFSFTVLILLHLLTLRFISMASECKQMLFRHRAAPFFL